MDLMKASLPVQPHMQKSWGDDGMMLRYRVASLTCDDLHVEVTLNLSRERLRRESYLSRDF